MTETTPETTTEPTRHPKLPLTIACIDAPESQPSPTSWSDIKKELKAYLKDFHRREEVYRDDKLNTLRKWEAKAGMIEKKRMAGLLAEADEHDQMHAAGVPGHIMLQFREEEAYLQSENLFFKEKIEELKALGFKKEDVEWVWSVDTDDDDGRKDAKD
jgi:hypothetical protein